MEKFYIRYHIAGEKEVIDVREFGSFAEAVSLIGKGLKNEAVGIVKRKDHVVEIQTKHITHHEVMTEKEFKKQRSKNELNNLFKSSLIPGSRS